MLRPNHGTLRLPSYNDDDTCINNPVRVVFFTLGKPSKHAAFTFDHLSTRSFHDSTSFDDKVVNVTSPVNVACGRSFQAHSGV